MVVSFIPMYGADSPNYHISSSKVGNKIVDKETGRQDAAIPLDKTRCIQNTILQSPLEMAGKFLEKVVKITDVKEINDILKQLVSLEKNSGYNLFPFIKRVLEEKIKAINSSSKYDDDTKSLLCKLVDAYIKSRS